MRFNKRTIKRGLPLFILFVLAGNTSFAQNEYMLNMCFASLEEKVAVEEQRKSITNPVTFKSSEDDMYFSFSETWRGQVSICSQEEVVNQRFRIDQKERFSISTEDYPSGVYFVRVKSDQGETKEFSYVKN